ncbi:hypothetical protein FJT64_016061 [Amphibalanus amphitrite]|uniref:Uncharacterized protein n=1 Tax=Amphibalanus amphitrite TaxID=1232801 RepID=A0A6A4X2A0_AMPAM|nr:hypothetical protein FJT64_016061 [Amphibalanus amphitrite]
MAALRRARHDPISLVQHDPTETLLALRGEISSLRRDVDASLTAERQASATLHGLAAATAEFVEQRRADLAAITAFVAQYGYEPPPPPPADSPAAEADGQTELPPAIGEPASACRQRPAPLDTPEEVQLSDVTVDMLRARTPGWGRTPAGLRAPLSAARVGVRSAQRAARYVPSPARPPPPAAEDDTSDATALLNFRSIPLPPEGRPSPAARQPPPEFAGGALLVTPGLWVKRRSTLCRQPLDSAKKPVLPPAPVLKPLVEQPPAAGARWGSDSCADDSMQSPELSAATRAMLARRKFGKA